MRSRSPIVLSGALFVFAAANGLPQESAAGVSGVDDIAARQASLDMSSITFRSMGDAMKAGREAQTQGYPAAALAKWAKALPRMFPAGTGPGETSADTQARPEVWRDRAGFERAAANYADQTARLAALAAANDTAGFTKQLDVVNQACAICHGRYKAGAQGPPSK
jgi:cytochrome c556